MSSKRFDDIEAESVPRGVVSPEEFARAEFLARLLDDGLRIPGTDIRFGLDAVLGLIPVIGDWLPLILSLYPIQVAWRAGVPKPVIGRMIFNVLIDAGIGSIPIVGDVFDLFWMSTRRNVDILAEYRRMDWD